MIDVPVPLAQGVPGAGQNATGVGSGAPTPVRILVVDDDASSRRALESLLSADGFVTSSAADGEAALAEVRRSLPDVVLTDLQMPRVNGIELCRRLHEIDHALPVIIMTAHTDMQSVIECLRAGAEDYLIKPLLADAVIWCVQRAIGRRAARFQHEQLYRELNERLVLSTIREQEHADAEALQRAQLNALLENLSEGVAIAEPGGRILMINAAARAILGFWDEAPTVDGLHLLEASDLGGTSLRAEQRPFLRALLGEQFVDYEVLRTRPDGERRRVISTGTSVRNAEGKVELAIVVFRDVTELRRLEVQREEHLALISHDLRNPLSTILMSVSLLRESSAAEGPRPPAHVRAGIVERAQRNALRMSTMLEELVEATHFESQGVALNRASCDLGELVVGMVDTLDEARARRITVEAEDASRYLVSGDASRLERVIINLLTNALKYSPGDTPVSARLTREGGSIALRVVDRGIGVAPESLKRLFDRYYRTTTGKAHATGLGLGLYIARMIVEAHGGQIAVSSEVDRGSTFRVMLPALGDPARQGRN